MSKLYEILTGKKVYKPKVKITEEEINAIHNLGLSVAQVYFGKSLQEFADYNPKKQNLYPRRDFESINLLMAHENRT